MKKTKSLSDMGTIRKQERTEPAATPTAPAPRKRGRPASKEPFVQLNTRIKLSTSNQIDDLVERHGWTMREVIEQAINRLHSN